MPDLYNLIKCKIEFIISIRGNMKSNKYLTNKKSDATLYKTCN